MCIALAVQAVLDGDWDGEQAEGRTNAKDSEERPLVAGGQPVSLREVVRSQVPQCEDHGRHEKPVDELGPYSGQVDGECRREDRQCPGGHAGEEERNVEDGPVLQVAPHTLAQPIRLLEGTLSWVPAHGLLEGPATAQGYHNGCHDASATNGQRQSYLGPKLPVQRFTEDDDQLVHGRDVLTSVELGGGYSHEHCRHHPLCQHGAKGRVDPL
mmetsp:Transcript_9209/g.12871  ORF Transcript_9209/g.12871 Transcript_9209/m.12871 type:complete len:212 (+) Transcript_9209:54-689(+)